MACPRHKRERTLARGGTVRERGMSQVVERTNAVGLDVRSRESGRESRLDRARLAFSCGNPARTNDASDVSPASVLTATPYTASSRAISSRGRSDSRFVKTTTRLGAYAIEAASA